MRIVYLHQYFNTPAQGGSLRSYYIAQAMAKAGHDVHLITTHNQETAQTIEIEGFTVHYLPIAYQNAFGFWQRIKAFFYFAQASYKLVQHLPTPDLVYATSTPLTVGLSALWLKKKLKIPYIFEVRDLWPLVPIELGILRNPVGKWLTRRWEKQIYRQAKKIIALSPAMQAHVKAIVPEKTVEMVSNMADTSVVLPASPTDKCIVAYFGTIGYANHLEYLVEIAKEAQTQQQNALEFWIVGKGARMEAVKDLARQYALSNIHFFEHQSTQDLQVMMQKVTVVYVSFLAHPVLATTSPNKFFEALAHSKLCVVNVEGWLRELVEQNGCGFYASPTEPQDFIEKIKPFLQNPALLAEHQRQARLLAERAFSTEILTAKILACLP